MDGIGLWFGVPGIYLHCSTSPGLPFHGSRGELLVLPVPSRAKFHAGMLPWEERRTCPVANGGCISLPETNSSYLKMDGWNIYVYIIKI